MRPPDALMFSFLRRVMTSLMSMPSRASCCWSIATSISSSRPPPTLTAATPVTGSMRFLRSSSAKRRSCLSSISLAAVGAAHARLRLSQQRRSRAVAEVEPPRSSSARQAEAHDRIGRRIEAQQQRLLRFERQLQRVELVAHLEARHVHVGAPRELEHDIGLAGARDRMHLAHVLDDADGLFDRLADQVLDLERRGAFVFGAHGQRRIRKIRQQVDLEPGQADQAEQHHRQRQHADGDAPARGQLGQAHVPDSGAFARTCAACACAGGGVSTVTSVPSRTALRPIVMTRSPSLRPSRTSTRSLSE